MRSILLPFLLLVNPFVGAPLLMAADGRIEINQASIDVGGGFPLTISEPGSYLLTGNLLNPSKDTHTLVITAPGIVLDLNGFRIMGPTTCTPACDNAGTGSHIRVDADHVTVSNGTLRGAGAHGIIATPNAGNLRIDSVRFVENFVRGMDASATPDVSVVNCMAMRNGADGFYLGVRARVEESVMAENGAAGAALFANGIITHSYAAQNIQSGFKLFGAGVALENVSISNAGRGFELFGNSGYGGNLMHGNSAGTVYIEAAPDDAHQLSPNACNGDTICP